MHEVETFLWRVPARGARRGYVSAVHLTAEEARQAYGEGATPVPESRKPRRIMETPEERRQVMQSAGRDGART